MSGDSRTDGTRTTVPIAVGGRGLIEAVVGALATASGTPVEDLNLELNEFVDPDALARLFAPRPDGTPRGGGRVALTVRDHEVEVWSDDGETASVRVTHA